MSDFRDASGRPSPARPAPAPGTSPSAAQGAARGAASDAASGAAAGRERGFVSAFTDLERPPLRGAQLARSLVRPDAFWTDLRVVADTGSTNTDLAARAAAGAPEGAVLIAEEQSTGRGRLDRRWSAPARSGIFLSVLLRPGVSNVPKDNWGWLPLLAGVAAGASLSTASGVPIRLKWPNDLLVEIDGEERKTGGILAELADDGRAVVLGMGINTSLRADELPVPTAASLTLAGAHTVEREILVRALLRTFAELYVEWCADGGDPEGTRLREAYRDQCATLGRTVRAQLPGGREVVGVASDVDRSGRLLLHDAAGEDHAVSAADVVHIRPASF